MRGGGVQMMLIQGSSPNLKYPSNHQGATEGSQRCRAVHTRPIFISPPWCGGVRDRGCGLNLVKRGVFGVLAVEESRIEVT